MRSLYLRSKQIRAADHDGAANSWFATPTGQERSHYVCIDGDISSSFWPLWLLFYTVYLVLILFTVLSDSGL